jgi:hypothetical protein
VHTAPHFPSFGLASPKSTNSHRGRRTGRKGVKCSPNAQDEASKVFQGVHSRLVFLDPRDERAVLDLMRRFSGAVRFAYQRLLEGKTREELKRETGPLCTLFGLNTRYADGP